MLSSHPSIDRDDVPVIHDVASDSRKAIIAATSSGRPTLFMGCISPIDWTCSELIPRDAWIGVSTTAGMTALTRTSRRPFETPENG